MNDRVQQNAGLHKIKPQSKTPSCDEFFDDAEKCYYIIAKIKVQSTDKKNIQDFEQYVRQFYNNYYHEKVRSKGGIGLNSSINFELGID